jgi:hypothetical protein
VAGTILTISSWYVSYVLEMHVVKLRLAEFEAVCCSTKVNDPPPPDPVQFSFPEESKEQNFPPLVYVLVFPDAGFEGVEMSTQSRTAFTKTVAAGVRLTMAKMQVTIAK